MAVWGGLTNSCEKKRSTLMAEREVGLKSLLMRVKEESEKAGLKLHTQKMKIMASGLITSWQIDETGNGKPLQYSCLENLMNSSLQFSSVSQLCPTLCDPMDRSTPGLPVHHQLPEFTQTHVHRVGDDIHPSHPLSSPFPPAPNPSQHQSLFQ